MRPNSSFRAARTALIWLLLLVLFWLFATLLIPKGAGRVGIPLSEFKRQLDKNNITEVVIRDHTIEGSFQNPVEKAKRFKTELPYDDPDLVKEMIEKGVEVVSKPPSPFKNILWNILPIAGIVIIWFLIFRQMQGGARRALTFGKSRAKVIIENRPKVTFADVAGVDEAKEELKEVIEFLKAPRKFQRLGGKIPKGVLLLGPPGTGKTLLARAVAGEAGVPFLSISGSDFVELFVGVGASRVRDLFEQAKSLQPCIIFIDEIDAVGRLRGAGLGGGHDEREQTLNQLLVEMDGFEVNQATIVIAATNRPDILDPALLRPGRFDRRIVIDRPDVKGRLGILKVHTKNIPLADEVDLEVIARGTPGFSGADLANLVNEAALLAARKGKDKVYMEDLEAAKDKVLMGVERRSLLISPEEKRLTAYHESGHVLVSKLLPNTDPIHKVTIIPRGRALGVTQHLPIDDRRTYTKSYLKNQLAVLLGGRAAEKVVFNDLSTGAGNDIEHATQIARKMVCEWGMSERVGPLTLGKENYEIFLGREFGLHKNISDETARIIDEEIKRLVGEAEATALKIIEENEDKLHLIARTLLEKEILTGDEIDQLLANGSK
ncbi:cell division protein FtsH, partial [candidate division WOR-3 bacterium]